MPTNPFLGNPRLDVGFNRNTAMIPFLSYLYFNCQMHPPYLIGSITIKLSFQYLILNTPGQNQTS